MKTPAIYVGRFNPVHKGHTKVIDTMLAKHGVENCMLVIGSSNAAFSLRHFFSYNERRNFIKKIFPDVRIVGLPDYHNDTEWLAALDDIISAAGMNPQEVTFFGGCQEDIRFFLDDGRKAEILNRFDGTGVKISATEVRDALIYDRPLHDMVHADIHHEIKALFKEKWEKFKKI
jgi:cytidyltransferase-like protein